MKSCIFTVNKMDANKKHITSVLNESGTLLKGDNLVIGKCKYAKQMNGKNIRSLSSETRTIVMPKSIGNKAKTISMKKFYSSYRPYKDYIKRLNHRIKPRLLSPKTKEDNTIHLYKIGNGKNKILITGGIHAREWLSPATVSYVADYINKHKDDEWKELLKNNTYYIIPVSNPDGYKYSYQSNKRYWRKNRNGVDLNRNFPIGFGGPGTSKDKNSDIYGGEEPFSELETQALKKVVDGINFSIHLDVHSFSQVIAGSWAYKEGPSKLNDDIKKYGNIMKDAMNKYEYGHGSLNGKLGLSGGSFQDYSTSKGILGYTIELPPKESTGMNGFSPDSSIIIPTGNDLLNGIKSISKRSIQVLPNNNYVGCAAMLCEKGYECVETPVQCITQPCYPIAECKKIVKNNKFWLFVPIIIVFVILIVYTIIN